MSNPREIEIAPDCLKAFGIALVVFGHVLRGLFASDIIAEQGAWAAIDRMIYLFHMPLFFYASGLFIERSIGKHGYNAFIKKAAITLLIPLVIWSYIQFSLQFIAGAVVNSPIGWFYVVTAPFPPRQQFWFLGALFLTMVAVGLMFTPKRKEAALWGVLIALLLFKSIYWETMQVWMATNLFIFTGTQVLVHMPFFILGALLGTDRMRALRVNSVICLLVFAASLYAYETIHIFEGFVHTVTSILCVLACYKIALNLVDGNDGKGSLVRVVTFVGMNSMIIYLAHVIAAAGFRVIFSKLGIDDANFHLVGGFLVGFLAPLFMVPVGLKLAQYKPRLAQAIFPVRYERA